MHPDQLKNHDGKEGRPAYVVHDGKVYDVSKSRYWKNGTHMARHHAGEDLTSFLSMAPHNSEVFARVELVGSLELPPPDPAIARRERLQSLYRRLHPHPIFIHFPIALLFFSGVLQGIFLLQKMASFEAAAYYCLWGGTLGAVPAIASGLFSWWLNYDLTLTTIFRNKLIFSFLSLAISTLLLYLRATQPGIALTGAPLAPLYNSLLFANIPAILFVANNGGKITWPSA